MAERTEADDEERAWALAQARAFLAPPGESSVAGRQSPYDAAPPAVVVLAVAVVPVPHQARGDETVRRRGDEQEEEQEEGAGDG